MTSFTCKVGTYWIGDPCYVFPNDGDKEHYWMDLLNQADYFNTPCEVTIDGITVIAGSTCYGDGLYMGNDSVGYAVDAGLLGIIPLETVIFLEANHQELERLGKFYYYGEDFNVEIEDGQFNFFQVIIDTDDQYLDEEDEEDEDDEEDEEDEEDE